MKTLLEFKKVNSFYGNAHILHNVDIDVKKCECVALIGRNGVGKTTVVNSILNIASVRSGAIYLNGNKQSKLRNYTAARAGVSVVPQGRQIIANLTIEENLLLGAAVQRTGKWQLESVYELFPVLRERRTTAGTALSGGQQQMLAIGRALMANPSLILLDEPSEGLAPVIIDQLSEVFNHLVDEGTALLLIEQNLSLISRVAKRFYVMAKGSITHHDYMEDKNIVDLQKYIVI